MGFIRDSIVMESEKVELRMDICEGEHQNHDGKGPLMTRLDFYEYFPGCRQAKYCTARREWYATLQEAQSRQRATIPAMTARYLELLARYE